MGMGSALTGVLWKAFNNVSAPWAGKYWEFSGTPFEVRPLAAMKGEIWSYI